MAIKQPYIVLSQERRFSKYGTPMIKITLVGVKDRLEYVTYIDEPNKNYKNWEHITRHSEHGFVLGNCTVKTHKDRLLINADSNPVIEWESVNPEEIFAEAQALWAEEDRRADAGTFRDLFK
jgi:hypothetical protein